MLCICTTPHDAIIKMISSRQAQSILGESVAQEGPALQI